MASWTTCWTIGRRPTIPCSTEFAWWDTVGRRALWRFVIFWAGISFPTNGWMSKRKRLPGNW